MAASATEQRPSEVNTDSYSVRIPKDLKDRVDRITKDKRMKRGWHAPLVTEFLTQIVAIHEKQLGMSPPRR